MSIPGEHVHVRVHVHVHVHVYFMQHGTQEHEQFFLKIMYCSHIEFGVTKIDLKVFCVSSPLKE